MPGRISQGGLSAENGFEALFGRDQKQGPLEERKGSWFFDIDMKHTEESHAPWDPSTVPGIGASERWGIALSPATLPSIRGDQIYFIPS